MMCRVDDQCDERSPARADADGRVAADDDAGAMGALMC